MVSIIVPALNEASHIGLTLRALKALEGEKEIIVVDGGSEDETISQAEVAEVAVLRSAQGRGNQQHAGALQATGNILWFVHADTIPPPNALNDITAACSERDVVCGNFGLLFGGRSRAARQLTAIYPMLRRLNLCYGDSGIFVRRSVYEAIGGFRSYPLFEDLDLLKRLRRTGRFVHLETRITTSSRRFENNNFGLMWAHWTLLQSLYWAGVSPHLLARWYRQVRHVTG